jgi:hypothetical protein
MPSCYDGSFLCQNPEYPDFDEMAAKELLHPPSVDEIINNSSFCTHLPLSEEDILGNLTHQIYLKGLSEKTGLYHLWIDHENCTDHDTFTMLGVYVGKGFAEARINDHIKNRWPNPAEISLYASFYECSNRISKYLEQLFLDQYKFILNKNENTGTKQLFAIWDEDRHFLGTEENAVSSLSNIHGMDDLLK